MNVRQFVSDVCKAKATLVNFPANSIYSLSMYLHLSGKFANETSTSFVSEALAELSTMLISDIFLETF